MKKEKELKPNILLKTEWDKMFNNLEDAEVGKLIKNCYNHLYNRKLLEMDRLESMLFENTILPVMNFNLNKYEEKCEHNRNAGKKGGRPKKETIEINPLSLVETHNNPSGYFNNPENPKDKDKVREKDKAIDKSENEILDTISRSNHEIKNNFEKVYNIDFALISDKQTKYFCYDVAELVNKLGWDRFMFLLHSSGAEIIASTLTEYGFPELKEKMLGVKRNYKFFFNKLPLNLE